LESENSATIQNEAWNEKDKSLQKFFLETQAGVDAALRNNFDTAKALHFLIELVKRSNSYMTSNADKKCMLD
jgi:cysteinyl-tRNA synthetase